MPSQAGGSVRRRPSIEALKDRRQSILSLASLLSFESPSPQEWARAIPGTAVWALVGAGTAHSSWVSVPVGVGPAHAWAARSLMGAGCAPAWAGSAPLWAGRSPAGDLRDLVRDRPVPNGGRAAQTRAQRSPAGAGPSPSGDLRDLVRDRAAQAGARPAQRGALPAQARDRAAPTGGPTRSRWGPSGPHRDRSDRVPSISAAPTSPKAAPPATVVASRNTAREARQPAGVPGPSRIPHLGVESSVEAAPARTLIRAFPHGYVTRR
jgi:hypothetical protein